MKQSKNYLVCVLEDVFQSSQLQNITVFLCTLYKMKKFRFYPLSYAHDRVFLNSPRRSPKAKKLPKDRGVSADLIQAWPAFMVQNLNHAAITTPPRLRLQSYDIHIFIIMLKHFSTRRVVSVVSSHSHDCINRTRAHVLIYDNSNMHWIICTRSMRSSVLLVFLELKQTTRKKGRSPRPYSTYILVC